MATVTTSGNVVTVTPVAAGITTITVTVSDGKATASDNFTVNVTAATGTQQTSPSSLQSPQNVQFIWNNDQVEVSWDAVQGAEHYKVYHDDFFSSRCRISSSGSPSFCDLLKSNVTATTYTHTNPHDDDNYYWVVACDSNGCSAIDSNSPAVYKDTRPSDAENLLYEWDGSVIRLSWDAAAGADYYKVYYEDSARNVDCDIDRKGNPEFCSLDILAERVEGTSYTHANPDSEDNQYWVAACNNGGCRSINGGAAAEPAVAKPEAPSDVQYIWNNDQTVVSWDAVEGADYYKVYYDDFHSSFFFAELLADSVSGTTYTHSSPDDDRNYYWVAACNRGGCSDFVSATFIDTRPAAPTNVRYVLEGSSIRVSWDAVSGAEYYEIHYEDFHSSFFFADLLVTDITGTSYLHNTPDEDRNYYWVAACNSGGCSDFVSATSDGT